MRWPLVLRSTFDRAVQRAGEPYLYILHTQRRQIDELNLTLRDLRERNRQLEGTLDSTDPYAISRRAAEAGNAEAAALVGALMEKKRLIGRNEPVPAEIEDIIRRGSQTWSRSHKVDGGT